VLVRAKNNGDFFNQIPKPEAKTPDFQPCAGVFQYLQTLTI
jgi:hypothetical protein